MKEITNEKQSKIGFFSVYIYMYVFGVLAAVACAFWLAHTFKVHRSEITLMVVAKSEKASLLKSDIMKNLAGIPKQLSFYELLLAENPDIEDPYSQNDAKHRKAEWDAVVDTKLLQNNEDSFFSISATMPNAEISAIMVQKTVDNLIKIAGRYYDIKNDVDLRIVDGPITEEHVRSWFSIVILSCSFGLLVILVLSFFVDNSEFITNKLQSGKILKKSSFAALNGIKDVFLKKEQNASEEGRKEIESIYVAEESITAPYNVVQEGGIVSSKPQATENVPPNLPVVDLPTGIYPDFAEIPMTNSRVSNAPANLPVAEEDFLESKPPKFSMPDHDEPLNIETEIKTHEPTQEELKARLNKLLKGEL